jgi:hypothetical protein
MQNLDFPAIELIFTFQLLVFQPSYGLSSDDGNRVAICQIRATEHNFSTVIMSPVSKRVTGERENLHHFRRG